jgi:hypothetical protein
MVPRFLYTIEVNHLSFLGLMFFVLHDLTWRWRDIFGGSELLLGHSETVVELYPTKI